MTTPKDTLIHSAVRTHYEGVARGQAGCCSKNSCGASPDASAKLGYTDAELASVPAGANLGLGCGNPQGLAAIQPGETVLDLGSGAGFDCFLAAHRVGGSGRVIGVDMTPAMIEKARSNAHETYPQVEFRLGEIENLPVLDDTVDIILSNCVINLAPDKTRVYSEAFRVLKPGGRIVFSDVVRLDAANNAGPIDPSAVPGCTEAALPVPEIDRLLTAAGFENVHVQVESNSRHFIQDWDPGSGIENEVASATIQAVKPLGENCCAPSCCA